MSTTDVPTAFIAKQALTTPPFILDNILVDDTVALVDSTTALVGSQTSIVTGLKANVVTTVPRPVIKISR